MITIITGGIHEGKTDRLLKLYKELAHVIDEYEGDGFISVKNIVDDQVIGYDYIRLMTGEKGILARKNPEDLDDEVAFHYGLYHFSKNGFNHVVKVMEELLLVHDLDLFLDEIGIVELEGLGYDELFRKMIERVNYNGAADIYVTIRRPFLEKVLEKYNITDCRIIDVSEEAK